jgi:hypothetical protein
MTVPFKAPKIKKVTIAEAKSYLQRKKIPINDRAIKQAIKKLTKERVLKALPKGRDVTVQASDAPRQVIYGYFHVPGILTFAATSDSNTKLHLVATLSGHELEQVEQYYLDDAKVDIVSTPGSSSGITLSPGTSIATTSIYLDANLGTTSQAAFAALVSANIGWTSAHQQKGCAGVYVRLTWNASLFADGIPDLSFIVKGKKCYDPRTATTVWTRNAALIAADYLTAPFGVASTYSRIDETLLIAAANTCDESVATLDGGTEPRYRIDGYFDMDEEPGAILERMAGAMAGSISFAGGKWRILPGIYRSPTVTLDEDDLRGDVKVETLEGRSGIFNRVRGTFASQAEKFEVVEYPPVVNATYLSQDGEEIWEDLPQYFTTSASACQRLAKIHLERVRQGITVSATFGLKALQLAVGDTVNLSLSRMGWSPKVFEIEEMDLIEQGSAGAPEIAVSLSLRETAAGVYDWNTGHETTFDLAPNSSLPSPFTRPTISGLVLESGTDALYVRGDGTVFSRIKVSWIPIVDGFVLEGGRLEVQYKLSASSVWLSISPVDPNYSETYILDVEDGQHYDVRVRALNALGSVSDWQSATNHFVRGKTEPPSTVTNFQGAFSGFTLTLTWDQILDLDADLYEIRVGASWAAGTFVARVRGESHTVTAATAGAYNYLIKAIDTSGNYSVTEASLSLTVEAPVVSSASFSVEGTDFVLSWTPSPRSFQIAEYRIRYGATWAGGTEIAIHKTTTFRGRVTWSGTRTFWVAPIDIAGNEGAAVPVDGVVVAPSAVTGLSSKVVDNNVLLSWTASVAGTLLVAKYRILRGATFSGATLVGETSATFSTLFEILAGSYTYWIQPVDSAGNYGAEVGTSAKVDVPPDFSLKASGRFTLSSAVTLTNCFVEEAGTLLLPVDKTKTFQAHFTDNSWTTPQDQVTAGYTRYIQPTPSTATYEQTFDFGATISTSALITFSYTDEDIVAGITLTPTLSFSLDGSSWTDRAGLLQSFESNFRYIKFKLAATGGGTAIKRINSVDYMISVKLKRDSGSVAVKASDSSGTTVTFAQTFLDVVGPPQLTPYELLRAPVFPGGNSNYLSHADHADFEPGNGDFTIAAWVYLDNVGATQVFGSKRQSAGQFEFILWYTAGVFAFSASHDGSTVTDVSATTFGSVYPGNWYFVAAYHDAAADKIGISVNGTTPQEVAFNSSGVFASTSRFQVGSQNTSTAGLMGLLKNLAVWKGRKLSASDISSLYAKGLLKYSELTSGEKTNLTAFYELGESSGNRSDSHTNARTLTESGTISSRILPVTPIADFTDAANPTNFKALAFVQNQVRASVNCSWYADGYTTQG